MIVYWDTSALVPLIVTEAMTSSARKLWSAADRLVTSRLTYAETVAALAMAERMGRITASGYRRSRIEVDRLHESLDVADVHPSLVRRAADLARPWHLRGYDAVHCATAEALFSGDLVVATGDAALTRACLGLGMAVADLARP